ncbi:MAG: hypothetical protein OEX81_05895 [Candidatus Pacebacteria bacterium]|nr:hypothetical protein [Candidatus Paceibacterota bacterium]
MNKQEELVQRFMMCELVDGVTDLMRNDRGLAIISDGAIFAVAREGYAAMAYPELNWVEVDKSSILEYREMYPRQVIKLGI